MAYGIRYTLTQELRDGTSLIVKIYEDGYTGASYAYTPTHISLAPNSNEEDPMAGVITSQLNVSFILSTTTDYTNFPDLLNSNDRKYYVELLNDTSIKWKGFVFNDYISLGFTTGNQEANFVCIDALSYLKYSYISTLGQNINSLTSLMSIINQIIYSIQFPTTSYLYSCCSYFAAGMNDRGVAQTNEPFAQTYQYVRDFEEIDLYTILDNIVKSFGCRLFQYNGDWWIMSINEIAGASNYFTKYELSPTTYYTLSGGLITETINIQPYSSGNVHLINNSQVKIVRKGYSRVSVTTPFDYAKNYITNGNFKQKPSGLFTTPDFFNSATTGTGSIRTYDYPTREYNDVRLNTFPSAGTATLEMGGPIPLSPNAYSPIMGDSEGTLSFNYSLVGSVSSYIGKIYIILTVGSNVYYLNSDKKWVTTSSYITLPYSYPGADRSPINQYSLSIPFGIATDNGVDLAIGYARVKFALDDNTNVDLRINNLRLTQSSTNYTAFKSERTLGTNLALKKEIETPYGAIYPDVSVSNVVGALYNASNVKLENWYRYGKTGTYPSLNQLVCRQYSNIFNKNLASLEGELGTICKSYGFIGLGKKFTIQDPSGNALSYDGKYFIANRYTVEPYYDQTTSLQLLEITNTDNTSTETTEYFQ
jgi:hypothetical protein